MAALTQQLSGPKFEALLEELRQISHEPTLAQIRDVMLRHGVTSPTSKDGTPSKMAATTLRDGPFKRYIERLQAGRDAREQLCAAAGAGASPVDAMEEMVAIELQDHFTAGTTIDVEWVIKQLLKLRTSISMREESRRKQTDLERKQRETEAKLTLAEQRELLLTTQNAALAQRIELQQFDAAAAVLKHAKEIKLVVADTKLDTAAKTERVRKILFGEKPADFQRVESRGTEET